jgi:drug/metabolite transporter (DMT)-like permease
VTALLPVVAAVASALAAATSTVLQHRASRRAPDGAPRRLLAHLVTSPAWTLGLAAAAVGLALHVLALSAGPLVLVQPLLVSGILFALPLSVVLEGRRPSGREWWLAFLLVVALATFLLTVRPSSGVASAATGVLLGAGAAVLVVVAGLAAAGLAGPGGAGIRASMLGAAGGLGFGLTAALLKQATAIFAVSPAALAGSWCGWAVVAVGASSMAVTQLAYRAGPLAASLPSLTLGDPLAAVVLGVLAFGERLLLSPAILAVGAASLVIMGVTSAVLAVRQEAHS